MPRLAAALGILFMLVILPGHPALAVSLAIDGVPRSFAPEPYITNTTVMVPLRAVMESLGAVVSWNASDSCIVCISSQHKMKLYPGKSSAVCDGREIKLPAAVILHDGSYVMPARAVVEALGGKVEWRNSGVEIQGLPGASPPNSLIGKSAPAFNLSAASAVQGHAMLLWLTPCQASDHISFSCEIPGVSTSVYPYGTSRFKLIGSEAAVPPGSYGYHMVLERQGVRLVDCAGLLQIKAGQYNSQQLWVDGSLAALRDPEKTASDDEKVRQALTNLEAEPLWEEPFIIPCAGRISTEYGALRSVNGNAPYHHTGIDIAADYGVPVLAANSGKVRLASMLNVTGNTVIIDHGGGVYTCYCHLDRMYVQAGNSVNQADAVGTVGSTGFSTGPHLHWIAGVDGHPLDPQGFAGVDPLQSIR